VTLRRHRLRPPRPGAVLAAALLAASCAPRPGRVPPAPAAGLVVLPPDYDPHRAYPAVELLPPTGNTAEAVLQLYLSEIGLGRLYRAAPERQLAALWPRLSRSRSGARREFILILARGRGRASDYRSARAWASTIARYERQVLADFQALAARRRIDTSRLVVAGFSLGGDLAWALALRNPRRLHGAVVMASRASYRPSPAEVRALRERGTRFFLTMGSRDNGTRRRLSRAAASDLQRWGLHYQYHVIPGAGHGPAPLATFGEALDFVLTP
jgi:predicted esterase